MQALKCAHMCWSPMQMFDYYLHMLQLQRDADSQPHPLRQLAIQELPKILCCNVCASCNPSMIAAAYLTVLRQDLGMYMPWPSKLQAVTKFALDMPQSGLWRNRQASANTSQHVLSSNSDWSVLSGQYRPELISDSSISERSKRGNSAGNFDNLRMPDPLSGSLAASPSSSVVAPPKRTLSYALHSVNITRPIHRLGYSSDWANLLCNSIL